MKIIVVDDEMSALYTFLNDVIGRTELEYKFFNDNEKEILDYVAKNKIAAAFLDICMPQINGEELAKKLIELSPDIKIVFITGLDRSEGDLDEYVQAGTIGFLYKPYDAQALERYLSKIRNEQQHTSVKMFDSFDCFVNEMPVRFSSSKSKELFALLLTYNGKVLSMTDAISQIWPDMDTDKSKPLYRDAVWRLRKTLKEVNFNCVDFQRAQMYLNKENISCDYWDFLANPQARPRGEFLKSYEWSNEYIAQ